MSQYLNSLGELEKRHHSSNSIVAQFHKIAIGVSDVQATHRAPGSVTHNDVGNGLDAFGFQFCLDGSQIVLDYQAEVL